MQQPIDSHLCEFIFSLTFISFLIFIFVFGDKGGTTAADPADPFEVLIVDKVDCYVSWCLELAQDTVRLLC